MMGFQVKPFAEVIAMTAEKLDETLAPIRARAASARADMEMASLEEQMVSIERRIHEACAAKDLNFTTITSLIDQYELTERRHNQINSLIGELFPEKV
jgi:hypothetical protein